MSINGNTSNCHCQQTSKASYTEMETKTEKWLMGYGDVPIDSYLSYPAHLPEQEEIYFENGKFHNFDTEYHITFELDWAQILARIATNRMFSYKSSFITNRWKLQMDMGWTDRHLDQFCYVIPQKCLMTYLANRKPFLIDCHKSSDHHEFKICLQTASYQHV